MTLKMLHFSIKLALELEILQKHGIYFADNQKIEKKRKKIKITVEEKRKCSTFAALN